MPRRCISASELASDSARSLCLAGLQANHSTMANFDESQAWPVLIDEFVEYIKDKGA
jgi:Cullin binding